MGREAGLLFQFYLAAIFALYLWSLELPWVRTTWEVMAYTIATVFEWLKFVVSWPLKKVRH